LYFLLWVFMQWLASFVWYLTQLPTRVWWYMTSGGSPGGGRAGRVPHGVWLHIVYASCWFRSFSRMVLVLFFATWIGFRGDFFQFYGREGLSAFLLLSSIYGTSWYWCIGELCTKLYNDGIQKMVCSTVLPNEPNQYRCVFILYYDIGVRCLYFAVLCLLFCGVFI